jgi:hypothetical protein
MDIGNFRTPVNDLGPVERNDGGVLRYGNRPAPLVTHVTDNMRPPVQY